MLSHGVPHPVAHSAASSRGSRDLLRGAPCPWPGLIPQCVPVLSAGWFGESRSSCWKAGIQALLHPAKRPKKEAGHSSSNSKRRKMGCVQDWRRGKQQKTQKGLWMSWKREQYSFLQATLRGEWCVCSSEQGFPHSDACVNMTEEPNSLLLHVVYIFM